MFAFVLSEWWFTNTKIYKKRKKDMVISRKQKKKASKR